MMGQENDYGPWIDWAGGECPIPKAELGTFQIMFRNGITEGEDIRSVWEANHYNWQKFDGPFCIVGYRLLAGPNPTSSEDLLRMAIDVLRKGLLWTDEENDVGDWRTEARSVIAKATGAA